MKKYVWINLSTGEFSNSWDDEEMNRAGGKESLIEHSLDNVGWKLIEYTCLNDANFEFFNLMRLA